MVPDAPDPAFDALLAEPRAVLRPPREGVAMAAYRSRLDAPMAAVEGPSVWRVEDLDAAMTGIGVPIRRYWPGAVPAGEVLFVHGGGFVVGSLATHDAMCRALAMASGARVTALAYRLAPEAGLSAMRHGCLAAFDWISTRTGAIPALCGDSAGGYLAVATALAARGAKRPVAALALLYPVVDPDMATESWAQFGEGHILTRDWMQWAWSAACGNESVSLLTMRLDGLPPTLILTAACDPLRDEGEALGAAAARAGVAVTLHRMPGMIHGFASLPMLTDRASEAVDRLAAHIRQHMC